MKKIVVINDLSGLGKCSLTAAIPVISVMGVQAVPLPTAILSAQTGFPSYYYDDYTDRMESIVQEWKKMDFRPDGVYSGFLSGAAQAEQVLSFIEEFKSCGTKILVDPVMGDNGEEYPIYTRELCEKMRLLAKKASLITPNLTEALLLLYERERAHRLWKDINGALSVRKEMIEEIGRKLSENFRTEAVITGIDLTAPDGTLRVGNLIVSTGLQEADKAGEKNTGNITWITAPRLGGSYSGTGDLFASVLAAGMVKGLPAEESARRAADFLQKAIRDTVLEGTDRNEGVCFENWLHTLA